MRAVAFENCRRVFDSWRSLDASDFEFDPPKGFSSFTMGIRARPGVDAEPAAVLYRHLDGKENAILDSAAERSTFLHLGDHEIAAQCHHYDDDFRLESFYSGRTLTADDVFEPAIQRGVAAELYRMHQLEPDGVPDADFFDLLHERWGPMVESVLTEHRSDFPADERALCDDLLAIGSEATRALVRSCLPEGDPVFCHNDTYHGNVFLCDDGSVKLLDFEFSCRNHPVFDFANFFAETVMVHGLAEPPHFRIAAPRFSDLDIARFIDLYLSNDPQWMTADRDAEIGRLLEATKRALALSDYMYAMAALPLALEPIQKIRFLPYAHQRFTKFLAATNGRA